MKNIFLFVSCMLFGEFGFDDSLDGESDDGEFLLIIDGLILLLKSLLFGI